MSREKFEAWTQEPRDQLEIYVDGVLKGEYCDLEMQYAWGAWQAAEAETARRCLAVLESVSPFNPMTANDCIDAIKAEFPEAFK